MNKLRSILADTLLPTRAWRQRLRAANREDRVKYWALRLGLAVLVIVLISLFDIHQHPALR